VPSEDALEKLIHLLESGSKDEQSFSHIPEKIQDAESQKPRRRAHLFDDFFLLPR